MPFRNREDAARLLSDRLERFKGQKTLVLGIPRGGVPMAAVVADRLDAEFDVMLVHKLRTPFQPELAFGSIDETGEVYLAPFAGDLKYRRRRRRDREAVSVVGARETPFAPQQCSPKPPRSRK